MTAKLRKFRAAPGCTVTLPKSVKTGPGVTTLMMQPGDEVEIEHVDRFIRGRVRAGDLIELASNNTTTTAMPVVARAPAKAPKE